MPDTSPDIDKPALRRQLRERRRQITPRAQRRAARRLAQRLARHPAFRRARRIAFYMPADGEISPQPLMKRALAMGKQCLLPVVLGNHLLFRRHRPGTAMRRNRYGIPEPGGRRAQHSPPWLLDLILVPLVGFDRRGNRLGMGAGFYDRSLARLRRNTRRRRPRLIGLAHSCQEVPRVPLDRWDIPLDAIVTEEGWITAGTPGTAAPPTLGPRPCNVNRPRTREVG